MASSLVGLIGSGPLAETILDTLNLAPASPIDHPSLPVVLVFDLDDDDLNAVLAAATNAVFIAAGRDIEAMTDRLIRAAADVGVEPDRVIGSGTVVDGLLLRREVAARLAVHTDDVHVDVIGAHGATGLPLWSSARVGGTPLPQFRPRDKRPITVPERSKMLQSAREQAVTADTLDGAPRLAEALAVIIDAIEHDRQRILNVTSRHDDFGDLALPPACYSVPTIVGRAGVVRVINELPLNPAEAAGLVQAAERLHEAASA